VVIIDSIIKNDDINICINKELYSKALSVLNDLSLDMTTAIDIYLRQIVIHQGLPFEVSLQSKQSSHPNDYDKETAYAQCEFSLEPVNDLHNCDF